MKQLTSRSFYFIQKPRQLSLAFQDMGSGLEV